MLVWPHRGGTQSLWLNLVLAKRFEHIQMEEVSVIFGEQSTNSNNQFELGGLAPRSPGLNPNQLIWNWLESDLCSSGWQK